MEKYFLYILFSNNLNHYYVGISSNPEKRLQYHNSQNKGWTKRGRPWQLIFQKEFESKSVAMFWESWIKKQKNRTIIEKIINNSFNW
ncbi:MAG TPA: GIY-YIG nuclease family protein [Candidatus Marinimicrobia bacterium]|nr:GIY-YIG nuclease family protein [Candidatus Neomarinimicrobiota bacterium]HOV23008.1 GIY-YIG nuclease family protein [Candidatus Neomarinimicrobiota bacterium]HQE94341.1 GIY-YIG nuclease family protein [Candidatus Neomarinimicrobiota bacterium]